MKIMELRTKGMPYLCWKIQALKFEVMLVNKSQMGIKRKIQGDSGGVTATYGAHF
jgi:hypothetical protein